MKRDDIIAEELNSLRFVRMNLDVSEELRRGCNRRLRLVGLVFIRAQRQSGAVGE